MFANIANADDVDVFPHFLYLKFIADGELCQIQGFIKCNMKSSLS